MYVSRGLRVKLPVKGVAAGDGGLATVKDIVVDLVPDLSWEFLEWNHMRASTPVQEN